MKGNRGLLPVTASDLYVQATCLKVKLFSMLSFCRVSLVLGMHGLLFSGFVFQLYEMIVGGWLLPLIPSYNLEKNEVHLLVCYTWGFFGFILCNCAVLMLFFLW